MEPECGNNIHKNYDNINNNNNNINNNNIAVMKSNLSPLEKAELLLKSASLPPAIRVQMQETVDRAKAKKKSVSKPYV